MANDTIQAYLQEAIDYASLENFGFCADDLVLFLENDTSSQRRFENHVLKMIETNFFFLAQKREGMPITMVLNF